MTLTFSRRLAVIGGVGLPLAEMARRCHQLGDIHVLPFWFDDVLIGAFLLFGAWKTGKDPVRGHAFLAAAWAFGCAMGYDSFFGQLFELSEPDPSGISSVIIVTIKGAMLAVGIAALISTLRWKPTP